MTAPSTCWAGTLYGVFEEALPLSAWTVREMMPSAGGLANHAHAGIVTVAGDLWIYSYGDSLGQSLRDVHLGPLAIPSGSGTPMDRALLGNDKVLMVT